MPLIGEYAQTVVAAAAAAAAIGITVRKGWPVVKSVARAVLTLEKIYDEFQPNGGSSLRDAVDEIRGVQKAQSTQFAIANQRLSFIEYRLGIDPPPGDGDGDGDGGGG